MPPEDLEAAFLSMPLAVWRQWVPDQEEVMAELPDSLTVREVQELLGGVPADLAACCGCLFLSVNTLPWAARSLWILPEHRPAMLAAAHSYREHWGIPPTPECLTKIVLGELARAGPPPAADLAETPAGPTAPGGPADATTAGMRSSATGQLCSCPGNCDTRCPACKGGHCPNVATVNTAISGKRLPAGYRGARPLCEHCSCAEPGCMECRRPCPRDGRRGPYCGRHARNHPQSPRRVPWQRSGDCEGEGP